MKQLIYLAVIGSLAIMHQTIFCIIAVTMTSKEEQAQKLKKEVAHTELKKVAKKSPSEIKRLQTVSQFINFASVIQKNAKKLLDQLSKRANIDYKLIDAIQKSGLMIDTNAKQLAAEIFPGMPPL